MPPLLYIVHPQSIDGVPGWRAAIHFAWESQVNDNPLFGCIGAWWAHTIDEADATAQIGLYTAMALISTMNLKYTVVNLRPDHDIVAGLSNLEWIEDGCGLLTLRSDN